MNKFTARTKENPYVMLDKTALNDKDLSWKAKGLHAYLISLPDDWNVFLADLEKRSKDGRDSTAAAIKELLVAGYVTREKCNSENGQFAGYDYSVYEIRQGKTATENPQRENRNGKTDTNKELIDKLTIIQNNDKEEETPTPFFNAEKINDTGAPSVQKPTKTPRGAGADFGAVKEDFEKFRLYAKKIGMTARGLDTEFENFVKKHPKEVLEVAPKLLACVMAFEAEKTEGGKRPIEPKFMPHVQTWINGRRWESYMEMEIETAQVDIMNSLLKMPYAEVGELFKKNVEGKIWERDYAVKLWNDYESKRPKQYTQYPQQ